MEPKDNMCGNDIDLGNYDLLTTALPSSRNGLWNQLNIAAGNTFDGSISNGSISNDTESKLRNLEKQVEAQALTIKLMRLKFLAIEGKFTQEEVANIRKMIMSEDEASKTLADSIIENA